MSIYTDRLTRVVAPRDGGTGSPAGACRALACNVSTSSVEVDNDILQLAAVSAVPATTATTPGSYGRAVVEFYADGNDLYLNFGQASTVVANSAAVTGNTQAACLPKGTAQRFELDPKVDKWLSARTINGNTLTATLRYRVVSFPEQYAPT